MISKHDIVAAIIIIMLLPFIHTYFQTCKWFRHFWLRLFGRFFLAVAARGEKKNCLHTYETNDCHFNHRLLSVLCYVTPTFALNY